MENYEKRLKDIVSSKNTPFADTGVILRYFPELRESVDERIRKAQLDYWRSVGGKEWYGVPVQEVIAWLEKSGDLTNPYSGISFEYNGHTWGMCARDNGVDILFDCKIISHLEKQDEQKPTEWSAEDEVGLGDALWAIKQARSIAKDENDMGNLWYAENWLKSLKDRVQPQTKQECSLDAVS
jgi:hypothetical protein